MADIFKFKLPIGDWSDDGHGQCDYFIVESNKSVEDVREAHFQIVEKTGINIEKICKQYEEDVIKSDDREDLEELGFKFASSSNVMSSIDMANIWVFLLMKADEALQLKIIPEEIMPMLSFYGRDEKDRNISFVGYGVFD